ncbi:MAG: histidine phosphatase family protein [Candidatus Eremiobacterota bacterium]
MRTLWVVRHGETVWNAEHRLTGWSDPPLSQRGEEQARSLRSLLTSEVFDAVWSSDLVRALRTAELAWGEARGDHRLREIDFGELDGADWRTLDARWRDLLLQDFDRFQAPQGEHASEFTRRVVEFVEQLPPGRHLVFSHGGVLRLLLRLLGQDQFLPNASVARILWDRREVVHILRGE